MRSISIILILSIILTSCSTVHYVNKKNYNSMKVILMQKNILDNAYLNSDSESGEHIRIVKMDKKSITYINENFVEKRKSIKKINEIYFINRGSGALKGTGIGFGAGFIYGISNIIQYEDVMWQGYILVGTIYGVAGSLIALPIGAAAGEKETYSFENLK